MCTSGKLTSCLMRFIMPPIMPFPFPNTLLGVFSLSGLLGVGVGVDALESFDWVRECVTEPVLMAYGVPISAKQSSSTSCDTSLDQEKHTSARSAATSALVLSWWDLRPLFVGVYARDSSAPGVTVVLSPWELSVRSGRMRMERSSTPAIELLL